MSDTLKDFHQHGMNASFHYADDTGREWDIGFSEQRAAEAIYEEHPELRQEMDKIAKLFLWNLEP